MNIIKNTIKKHVKDIKIFLKKKKTKGEKSSEIDKFYCRRKKKRRQYYQERKQKLPEYRANYYLTHQK